MNRCLRCCWEGPDDELAVIWESARTPYGDGYAEHVTGEERCPSCGSDALAPADATPVRCGE